MSAEREENEIHAISDGDSLASHRSDSYPRSVYSTDSARITEREGG